MQEFDKWLTVKKLSDKTIRKHLSNVNMFLNIYLNHYDVVKMEDGIEEVDMYLSDFFIRKCMWSTAFTMKQTASSIKIFYRCMNELGYVEDSEIKFLNSLLKENMEDYIDAVNRYNNFDDEIDSIFNYI